MSRIGLLTALFVAAVATADVRAGSPLVRALDPHGGQRGTEVDVTFYGDHLHDAVGLLFLGTGIEVVSMTPDGAGKAQARLRIGADCVLGDHLFFLRTRSGLSNLAIFAVGVLPELAELEPNDAPSDAQVVALDTTINGLCTPSDVDVYAFDAPAGRRVSFEIQGVRLGDTALDLRLELLDAAGRVLAEVDDTALGRLDPLLSHTFATAGRYFVRLREERWGGSAQARYRLHLGFFPRPTSVFPAGGRRGDELDAIYVEGDRTWRQPLVIPKSAGGDWEHFPEDAGGIAPTPLPVPVNGLPNVTEVPGGTAGGDFTIPAALNGIIAAPGEVDTWWFAGEAGVEIGVATLGRRLRSPLDPYVEVLDDAGHLLRRNDDAGGPDSYVRYKVRRDGRYCVRIRDLVGRGGPEFVYRLQVTVRRPGGFGFGMSLTPGSLAPSAVVPRGGRMAVLIRSSGLEEQYERELSPRLERLPSGVSCRSATFREGALVAPVVFEAAADAPLAASLARFTMWSEKEQEKRNVGFGARATLVVVDGNRTYLDAVYRELPVVVSEEVPYRVDLVPPSTPVVPGSPTRLEVQVVRQAGFTGPVTVRMLWNPPGLAAGQVVVKPGESSAHLDVNARADAAPGVWPVAVVGLGDVGGGVVTSSELVELEVAAPWYEVEIGKVTLEPGTTGRLAIRLRATRDVTTALDLELRGLPRGVRASGARVAPGAASVDLEIDVAPDTRPGRYRDLMLRFDVLVAGGAVTHQIRGGEIRIAEPPAQSLVAPPHPADATAGGSDR